jgi:hypothetical protein
MRYIATKKDDKFLVSGIKSMTRVDDDEEVEVYFASQLYDKKQLEDVIENYTKEKDLMLEKYEADITDMKSILEAINNCN